MDSKFFFSCCQSSGINPESVSSERKLFVLVHFYLDTRHFSIVAFSDSYCELAYIRHCHPRFGSFRHFFGIYSNHEFELVFGNPLSVIKDKCLINICKNVAEFLSVAEYAMLRKSYFKSTAWFEKAKNCASLGAEIIENY